MSRAASLSFGSNRALLAVSVAAAVAILFVPARQFVQQRQHIADLRTKISQLNKENTELGASSRRLHDPAELELLARQRLGLVRPGERAYFIEESAPAKKAAAKVEGRTNPFGRGWHWLIAVLRGRN